MFDTKGNLVTTSSILEKITIETYKEILNLPLTKTGVHLHHLQREKLCNQRFEEAHENKTPPWTIGDMDIALKHLKANKSRDP